MATNIIFAHPTQLFDYQHLSNGVAKAPVLHGKSACFALQYRLFFNAKQALLKSNIENVKIIDSRKWFSLQPKPTIARAENTPRHNPFRKVSLPLVIGISRLRATTFYLHLSIVYS